jgi:hypothetical protein
MATLEHLISRTRLEMGDVKEPFYEQFSMSGRGRRVDLKAEHLSSFYLYPKGEPENVLTEGEDFVFDPRRGIVTFTELPEEGARFVAEGESSRHFTDEEMTIFVGEAFEKHTRGRPTSLGSLPRVEDHLVAILAAIEAIWVLKASAAYDVNIHAPEGMFVPRGQRFQQLNTFLMELEDRYKELSGALGVGLYAVEMFNLRRVSRLTGRYVPMYLDREIDDTRPPQRVFPRIGNMFGETAEETIPKETLHVVQGRAFERVFEMVEDDAAASINPETDEIQARLLRTPFTTHLMRDVLPQFTVTQVGGDVTLYLSGEQTRRLESTASYHWTLALLRDGEELARIEGPLLVEAGLPKKSVHVRFT